MSDCFLCDFVLTIIGGEEGDCQGGDFCVSAGRCADVLFWGFGCVVGWCFVYRVCVFVGRRLVIGRCKLEGW
jgi:hypothetical protein